MITWIFTYLNDNKDVVRKKKRSGSAAINYKTDQGDKNNV